MKKMMFALLRIILIVSFTREVVLSPGLPELVLFFQVNELVEGVLD